eukprot:g75013.t1
MPLLQGAYWLREQPASKGQAESRPIFSLSLMLDTASGSAGNFALQSGDGKPCPACGADNINIVARTNYGHYGKCKGCGHYGVVWRKPGTDGLEIGWTKFTKEGPSGPGFTDTHPI